MPDSTPEPGSFRDRSARVFYHDATVFRALSSHALEQWEALSASRFHSRAVREGRLVFSERVDPAGLALPPGNASWAAVLRHEPVPFVSYPYEWSFGMLRDAALLQLDLLLEGLEEGLTLKDASPYNVQWRGTAPVFVDVASFGRWAPGEPWMGYRQFCQLFLYPLLIAAYRDVDFHPWLRGSLEGVDAKTCFRVLGARSMLRPGVATHVYLQARAQAAWAHSLRDVRHDLRTAGFSRQIIQRSARGLRKLVAGLTWRRRRSTWSEYRRCPHCDDAYGSAKAAFVLEAASSRRWRLAWDLGCNTGAYSRLIASHADTVVAMDADHLSVHRLYQELRANENGVVLPLVLNLADPSPGLGWRNLERKRLTERGTPDLVLCLALLHHLVIGANIPLPEVVEWLSSLGSELVIEFATREDEMVRRLLRNKDDQYADYDLDGFERALIARYVVVRRETLPAGTRTLYWARPRGG